MHTLLMETFHNYTKVNDLVTFSFTFMMKIAILDLVTASCINFVFCEHILIILFIIYQYSLNIKRDTLILNFLWGFVKYFS